MIKKFENKFENKSLGNVLKQSGKELKCIINELNKPLNGQKVNDSA